MTNKHQGLESSTAADLIYHLGRLASQADAGGSLTQAQWAALRYFDHASLPSRTPSGFASFHATTRGTASQTIRSLEGLGYLRRCSSDHDGRSVRFELTGRGRAALDADPMIHLEAALSQMSPSALGELSATLRSLLARVASARGLFELGICDDCGLYRGTGRDGAGTGICLSTGEKLARPDIGRLCTRFSRREDIIEEGPV